MPVDRELAHTWPLYVREFETRDARMVVTTLAEVAQRGAVALVPEVQVIGRNELGLFGSIVLGGYTIVNDGSQLAVSRTAFSLPSEFGASVLTVTVTTEGRELLLNTMGMPDTRILWSVVWRVYEFAGPEG